MLVPLLLVAPRPGMGANLDGTILPDSVNAFDNALALSSCGMREILWTELYAVAFYLPRGKQPTAAMWDPVTPKLIRVEIVYDGKIPDDLPPEWRRHLKDALSREALKVFRNLYEDLVTGDVVAISYAPNATTQVTLNDEVILRRLDHGLIEAMLELWIGHKPVSKNLRRLLLSDRC